VSVPIGVVAGRSLKHEDPKTFSRNGFGSS
jgi:hypothetical protein